MIVMRPKEERPWRRRARVFRRMGVRGFRHSIRHLSTPPARSEISSHVLAWGETREEMKQRIRRLNRKLLPIGDGLAPAHQKCISKGKLASKIGYMLKAPQNGYRVFKGKRVIGDGQVISCFIQKKCNLRPGERLTLFQLMKDMRLDELTVAGGEGKDILRRVKRRLLRDLPKSPSHY
jgi:hypothetical protein